MSVEKSFEKAIELRNNEQLEEASSILTDIIKNYPHHPKLSGIYTVLGGVHMDLKDYIKSSIVLKKATELNPKSELASLCLYLSYVKLEEADSAIEELTRYLSTYPANLYKDTLVDLLKDLNDGYASSFKSEILKLARKNGVIGNDKVR